MFKVDKITIAVRDMEKMKRFYSATFECEFKTFELQGRTLNLGKFGEISLLLCPADLAGVEAENNTIQVRLVVDDLKEILDKGLKSGGRNLSKIQELQGERVAALRDPDGNSIELIQK